jgi:hypothetical protein
MEKINSVFLKSSLLLVGLVLFLRCNNDRTTLKTLQSEINYVNLKNDSLAKEIQQIKPGLGDFMLMVQVHHNKLFFAGKDLDWPLAQFEHDEILEILAQAEEIEKERNEVKLFKAMIYPQLDSIQLSIKKKDVIKFTSAFTNLTNACNNCHTNTKYGFNKITIPTLPPYSNQDFTPVK